MPGLDAEMVTVRDDAGEGHFGHVDAEAVRLIDPAGIGDPHRRTGHLAVAQQAAGWSSRVVLGPTVQRQPRIATQVERLERTGLSITATSRCGAPPPVAPDLSDREAFLERALADELVAMTLEQTELLQRTGAGRPMGRRSRTWSTASRFRGPAGSPPPPAFALVIARAAHPWPASTATNKRRSRRPPDPHELPAPTT